MCPNLPVSHEGPILQKQSNKAGVEATTYWQQEEHVVNL